MNAAMVTSLCKDALYQVLDNKVFRVLLVLVLIPVLATLIFGFREDEIVFLFGLKRWSYEPLLKFFTTAVGSRFGQNDPQTLVINGLSGVVIEGLAGTFGVIFTIAATAFFVPRMIEKGAADVLFHKPMSRLCFYLSRYFAGLVFIALFSGLLVGGMYLGFLVVSGHNDPGILWAAVTLTYLFGLIHAVSMLVGVVTRSTVAAILLTMIFFLFNGCIHQIWIQVEQGRAKEEVDREAAAQRRAEEDDEGAEPEAADAAEEERPAFARLMIFALDAVHYIGPKTTDADYLTARLRAAVEGEDPFLDPESRLAVLELKGGLEESEDAGALAAPVPGAQEALGEPVFHAVADGGRSLAIWSRPRRELTRELAGRKRDFLEDGGEAADELEGLLAKSGATDVTRKRMELGEESRFVGMMPAFVGLRTTVLSWNAGERRFEALLFAYRSRFHALVLETPADLPAEERDAWSQEVLKECGVLYEEGQSNWYGSRLGWTSELKFNLFFSLGSSLAFAAAMLLLGWWRLSRIDF